MHYQKLLTELESYSDENYKNFHKSLLKNDKLNVLGVKTPILRKIAKKYLNCVDKLFTFPDEYYEVTFIKLAAVSLLKWDDFINYVDGCVALIDNWATCDCFVPKCIIDNKGRFLPYIYKYLNNGKEFYQRFALTSLLHFYVEDIYLDTIFGTVKKVNLENYYVHMAAAWLIAEVLVKFYEKGVEFLKENSDGNFINKKTHNKAIQKALESYRLTEEQKKFLKGIKK